MILVPVGVMLGEKGLKFPLTRDEMTQKKVGGITHMHVLYYKLGNTPECYDPNSDAFTNTLIITHLV